MRQQDRAGVGPLQVGEVDAPATQGCGEVGVDHRGDLLKERARAVDADLQPVANRAGAAVGRHQVVGAEIALGAVRRSTSRAVTTAINRDAAAQLFISPRTVAYHLCKVFAKLGISSRSELIRLAHGGDNQLLASDSAAAPA